MHGQLNKVDSFRLNLTNASIRSSLGFFPQQSNNNFSITEIDGLQSVAAPRGKWGELVPPTSAQAHFCKSCKSVNFFFWGRGGDRRGPSSDLFLFLSLKHDKNFKKSLDKVSRELKSIQFYHKILPFHRYASHILPVPFVFFF